MSTSVQLSKDELRALYFVAPLYSCIKVESKWKTIIKQILDDISSYDGYCKKCGAMSVFHAKNKSPSRIRATNTVTGPIRFESNLDQDIDLKNGSISKDLHQFLKTLQCTRCSSIILIQLIIINDEIQKIGSYPSIADLQIGELSGRISISTNKIPRELSKAVGLKAHGANIGAFAYLRRVYETLIMDARNDTVAADPKFDIAAFDGARANEKIKMLKEHLPDIMTKNISAYGILSKGIHELSESDCADNFEILFELISVILEEREELKRKAERERSLTRAISATATRLQS